MSGTSDAAGVATLELDSTFTSTQVLGSSAFAEVYVQNFGIDTTASTSYPDVYYFHPLDGQFGHWACSSLVAGSVSVVGEACGL